jgi:hypothetical protein
MTNVKPLVHKFDFEIGTHLKLESFVIRVDAKNKKDAISKIKKYGFNAGYRVSSSYSGRFKPVFLNMVKEE